MNNCPRSFATWGLGLLLLAFNAHGDVRLPAIISDHAILQKSTATTIWGWSDPGEPVTVTLDSVSGKAIADAQGHWKATLNLSALGPGPFQLNVEGKNKLVVSDVLVGDVWLSSGQSNMQFTLNATTNGWTEIAQSANPSFRWFMAINQHHFLEEQNDVPGKWLIAGPDTSGDCSGVAYYFGKKIQADLKMPVGLVLTAVGGTTIQSWMSEASLDQDPALKSMKDADLARVRANPNAPKRKLKAEETSTFFYNQLIHPLQPLSLRGVIWYQGEAHFNQGDFYRKAFPAMIRDWRALWNQPALPFYYCQLPNLDKKTPDPAMDGWVAGLREAQDSGLKEPQTGEAVLIDVGTEELHPTQKDIVGLRLALLAEAGTYGLDVKTEYPRFESMKLVDGRLEIHFTGCKGGLLAHDLPKETVLYSPGSPVQGFTICGDDKNWVWAQATIVGDKVTVLSPGVQHPVTVRYAWSNNPTCNLYNQDGFPAAPFQAQVTP